MILFLVTEKPLCYFASMQAQKSPWVENGFVVECICPFGRSYLTSVKHRHQHQQWENGVRVPLALRPLPMLCDVPAATAPIPLWKFSAAALWPGAQEINIGRSDIYPLPGGDGRQLQEHPPYRGRSPWDSWADRDCVAHLLIKDNRAIALQTSRLIRKWEGRQPPPDVPIPTPAILFAWTAVTYRRQGYARTLTEHVAHYRNCAVKQLVWVGPFSEEGRALAKELGGALVG
jgi:hypothetical protein